MNAHRDTLLDWLRDAHAMEEQAETMLSAMAKRIENYPDLRTRIEAHLEETQRHAHLLRGCLERLGGETSVVKDVMGKFVAIGQGFSGIFVADEIIKGSMASYTFEHMEIVAYKVLISAAESADDGETRAVCQSILREEEAMAAWLAENIGPLTQKFLMREEAPELTAKH